MSIAHPCCLLRFSLSLFCYVMLGVSAVRSQILPPFASPTRPPPAEEGQEVNFPPRQNKTLPVRLYPGMQDFPEAEEFSRLASSLDGVFLTPMLPGYPNATIVHNVRMLKYPYAHVMATTVEDVQRVCTVCEADIIIYIIRIYVYTYYDCHTREYSPQILAIEEKATIKSYHVYT